MSAREAPDAGWWDGLFSPPPEQWGLRGDPLLWQHLRATLRDRARPTDTTALEAEIVRAIETAIGAPVAGSDETVFVPDFARGGMSSGHVHLDTWRGTLIPLLIIRSCLPRMQN